MKLKTKTKTNLTTSPNVLSVVCLKFFVLNFEMFPALTQLQMLYSLCLKKMVLCWDFSLSSGATFLLICDALFFFPVPQLLRIKMSLQWFRSARFYSFVNLPGKAFVLGPGYSLCGCKVLLKVNVRSLWADGDSCFKSLSTANTQKLSEWFLLKQRSGRPNVWILRRDLELVKADLSPEKGTSALASSLEGRGDSGCRPL